MVDSFISVAVRTTEQTKGEAGHRVRAERPRRLCYLSLEVTQNLLRFKPTSNCSRRPRAAPKFMNVEPSEEPPPQLPSREKRPFRDALKYSPSRPDPKSIHGDNDIGESQIAPPSAEAHADATLHSRCASLQKTPIAAHARPQPLEHSHHVCRWPKYQIGDLKFAPQLTRIFWQTLVEFTSACVLQTSSLNPGTIGGGGPRRRRRRRTRLSWPRHRQQRT